LSTLSRKRRYGISSSGLAASLHTGHLLPSLSKIPLRPHSSQAEPAQQGIITASLSRSWQMGQRSSLGIFAFAGRGVLSSGSQGERSTLFWLYACFSISLMTIKPWGLIFAPGTFDSAGFKKLLGMPVVRFISLLANGQSDTQWFPRHLLHFQCGGGFAPSANAFWPLYLTQCLSLYISVELLIIFEILSSSVSPSLLAALSPGMLAKVEVCWAEANTAASTPFSSSHTFFLPSPRGARWTVRVVFLLINSSSSR